jgi:hypothetical protein
MTLKIQKIISIEPYSVVCRFNNGIVRQLDIKPLIENHTKLKGIDKLLNENIFRRVRIGKMGELLWKKVVEESDSDNKTILWDFDISPEFFFQNSKDITSTNQQAQ